MRRQRELFPEPETVVEPHATRREPPLWVRRVLIWSEPERLVREVELRRGLNVIWSPDAGTEEGILGTAEASGHGAGKSLFCRLIRYCLGEHGFATSDLTDRIGRRLVEGWVGIELSLEGQTWGIVRPLGHSKKSRVGRCPPEQLLQPGKNRPGVSVLLEAISEKILDQGIETHMPGSKEFRGWLTALAWLSRDQDCRFGHILEWRHTATESESPVLGLSKESHLIAVRLLLGIVAPRELIARRELDETEAQAKRTARALDQLAEDIAAASKRLAAAFPSADPTLGPLWVTALQDQAAKREDATEAKLDELMVLPEVARREEERHHALRELAELWARASASLPLLELLRKEHETLRTRRAALPVATRPSKAKPAAKGSKTGAAKKSPKTTQALAEAEHDTSTCAVCRASTDRTVLVAELEALEHRLASEEIAIEQRKLDETHLVAKAAAIAKELEALVAAARADQKRARDAWYEARRLREDAVGLAKNLVEQGTLTLELEQLGRREAALNEEVEALRKLHERDLARFEALFRYVCKGLLGTERDASLTMSADRLRAQVSLGGTAMESLKSVAFDLAAMLSSIERPTSLPAFLIHDSPREADLGASHYQTIFRFVRELEGLGEQPPFQYIITTTTDPPKELLGTELIRLELSGSTPKERLLKVDV